MSKKQKYPKTLEFGIALNGRVFECKGQVNNIFEEQLILKEMEILQDKKVKFRSREDIEKFLSVFKSLGQFFNKATVNAHIVKTEDGKRYLV